MGKKVAIFLPSLHVGGAERVMVNLAQGFTERCLQVDLVLAKAKGPFLAEVPKEVRIVDLNARRCLCSLPGLVRYLRRERPAAMISALSHANIVAIWANILSGAKTQLVVSEHSILSQSAANAGSMRDRIMPFLIKQFYPKADSVVAVSNGVANDLSASTGLNLENVKVIYNPGVMPDLFSMADEPLDHPWFATGELPVILGAGRLTKAKDFTTLIRAFALVRQERPVRLMILGEGEERHRLEALVRELGLERDAALPGFTDNPYKYMKRAAIFVLSSRWEGFGMVLVEAMALGTPVVSTDCPSGPAEILEGGKWGCLVPAGDAKRMAESIITVLHGAKNDGRQRSLAFTLSRIGDEYGELLGLHNQA